MGLEDQIKEEMYVDTESLLEEEFGRAAELFEIYEDNTVAISETYSEAGPREKMLIHMVAWQYIAEANENESPGLEYEYFYERINAGDSSIRRYANDFIDEGLVRENSDGEKEAVVERLSDIIDRIESTADE